MKNNTLEELVKKSQRGDTKAFDELICRERERITKYSLKICHGKVDAAEEVCQLATIKAWKNIKKFHMNCAFHTWFYKIARNLFYDMFRSQKNKKFYSLDQEKFVDAPQPFNQNGSDAHFDLGHIGGPRIFGYAIEDSEYLVSSRVPSSPDEAYAKKDLERESRTLSSKILGRLSKEHRDVLRLREIQGMLYSEIAKELNISEGTVMSRLHYARKKAQRVAATVKEG